MPCPRQSPTVSAEGRLILDIAWLLHCVQHRGALNRDKAPESGSPDPCCGRQGAEPLPAASWLPPQPPHASAAAALPAPNIKTTTLLTVGMMIFVSYEGQEITVASAISFSATAAASSLSAAADEMLRAFAWLSFSCTCRRNPSGSVYHHGDMQTEHPDQAAYLCTCCTIDCATRTQRCP